MRDYWKLLAALVLGVIIAACGGGSSVKAQAAKMDEVSQLHFIIRPNREGRWEIMNDATHRSIGVNLQVEQFSDSLRVNFLQDYTHAVTVQITSDDDFRDKISGHANLGLNSTVIKIVSGGRIIDPSTVWQHVPLPPTSTAGNLWVTVTMLNDR